MVRGALEGVFVGSADLADEALFASVGFQLGAFGVGVHHFVAHLVKKDVEIQGVVAVDFVIGTERAAEAVDIAAAEAVEKPTCFAGDGARGGHVDVVGGVVRGVDDGRIEGVAEFDIGVGSPALEAFVFECEPTFEGHEVGGVLVGVEVAGAMGDLETFFQRELPEAKPDGACGIEHKAVASVLEGVVAGAIGIDEGIAHTHFEVWQHLVLQGCGSVEPVEAGEVVVDADFLL